MSGGRIVAGVLSPHPPHLVYADNPPQNEPCSEGGWEELRWGYERCRAVVDPLEPDVLVVHSPHWKTVVGHHTLMVPRFEGLSVDPIFPHLFRYRFALDVDVDLAALVIEEGEAAGLVMRPMTNPHFRVDYGTITSCHLMRPQWDTPIVGLSSNNAHFHYSNDVGEDQMKRLGEATARAVERSGKRAVLLASNSLSHRHFVVEPELPEDMSKEHVTHHGQYLWDMHVLGRMRRGECRALLDEMPDFTEQAVAETKDGCLSWMLHAMGVPDYPAQVHAYGSVIGTGNAVVSWVPEAPTPPPPSAHGGAHR